MWWQLTFFVNPSQDFVLISKELPKILSLRDYYLSMCKLSLVSYVSETTEVLVLKAKQAVDVVIKFNAATIIYFAKTHSIAKDTARERERERETLNENNEGRCQRMRKSLKR